MRKSAHKKHLQKIGSSVVKGSFPAMAGHIVLRIKFCGGRNFCASKSATSRSAKTSAGILQRHHSGIKDRQ